MAVELEHASKEWLAQDRTAQPKPCPFCGSDDLWIAPWHGGAPTKTHVGCEECRIAPGACEETYAQAVSVWNVRVGEARLSAVVLEMEDRIDQLRCPWDGLGEAHQEILDRAEAKANNGNFPLIEQILNAYAALEADLQEARAERDGLMEQAADVREQLEQAVGEITDLQQQLDLYRDAYGPLAAQRVGELTQASEAACAVDEEPY